MCVISCKYVDKLGWVGVKNRDRNYKPTIQIRNSFRNGIERLYLYDEKTKYTEGINEFGVAIISAAVAVKKDEKEGDKSGDDRTNFASPDGKKIRTGMFEKTVPLAIKKLIELELPGNTLVFSKDICMLLEATHNDGEYIYKTQKIKKDEVCVRTNHGILIESGYNKEDDPDSYASTVNRYEVALKNVKKANTPEEMMEALSDTSNSNPQLNPLRTSKTHGKSILVTTGQTLTIPSELTLHYRPIWCEINVGNFSKVNSGKTKCFYEIISARKLISIDECSKFNNLVSKILN